MHLPSIFKYLCFLVTGADPPLSLLDQVSPELLEQIKVTVLQKTIDGMKAEGAPYVGRC